MSETTSKLERRARTLLRVYPAEYRQGRAEEIIDTLLEAGFAVLLESGITGLPEVAYGRSQISKHRHGAPSRVLANEEGSDQ